MHFNLGNYSGENLQLEDTIIYFPLYSASMTLMRSENNNTGNK